MMSVREQKKLLKDLEAEGTDLALRAARAIRELDAAWTAAFRRADEYASNPIFED